MEFLHTQHRFTIATRFKIICNILFLLFKMQHRLLPTSRKNSLVVEISRVATSTRPQHILRPLLSLIYPFKLRFRALSVMF